jgi:hypothetical protein
VAPLAGLVQRARAGARVNRVHQGARFDEHAYGLKIA